MKRSAMLASVFLSSLLPTMSALASPPVTLLQALNPAYGQLPESITVDDAGNLYFSMGGTLQKYTADHQLVQVVTIPVPVQQGAATLGVKVGPAGYIYMAVASFNPAVSVASVWREPQGNLYLTDSAKGQIWKIDQAGNAEVWFADPLLLGNPSSPVAGSPLGANGIAFDRSRHSLYVANTDYGRILRISFHHGRANGIEVVAASSLLVGADGA